MTFCDNRHAAGGKDMANSAQHHAFIKQSYLLISMPSASSVVELPSASVTVKWM